MGNACSDNRTIIEKQVDDFVYMLRQMPQVTKYTANASNVATFTTAWSSAQFGGTIFGALGSKIESKVKKGVYDVSTRDRKNNLLEVIKKTQP